MSIEGTREPIHDMITMAAVVAAMLLTTLSLPWWDDM
jgi:hypothetical protein